MGKSVRLEARPQSDRIYPGAVFVPDGVYRPHDVTRVQPVYATAWWSQEHACWMVKTHDVFNDYGAAYNRHCRAGMGVDRSGEGGCCLVAVFGIVPRMTVARLCVVVLDVVQPAGQLVDARATKGPCGLRWIAMAIETVIGGTLSADADDDDK